MISEATLNAQSHVLDHGSSIEHWAMNRAHQIVVHQGMRLVEAAQSLDRKQTSANTYALRKAIMDCLIEAMKDGPHPTAAE
ncbi:hypothetical protein FHP24_13080 [Aliirhizobium smilacinae]|jgi:hypothetical protein|uniref:Uncharacterized protein n=2 Tax=Aliirhizobium smilacinae TaxID=1395944 RepID=A0A5C4XK80_9HYPH|nr:hypothetical protein [Rhizobium smilacinae]TNM63718.1 hypothetical protein FHP24_13080 [Rhizobium smilacinae]